MVLGSFGSRKSIIRLVGSCTLKDFPMIVGFLLADTLPVTHATASTDTAMAVQAAALFILASADPGTRGDAGIAISCGSDD